MSSKNIVVTVPAERRTEAVIAMAHAIERLASALDRPNAAVTITGCQFTGADQCIVIAEPQSDTTETQAIPTEDEANGNKE